MLEQARSMKADCQPTGPGSAVMVWVSDPIGSAHFRLHDRPAKQDGAFNVVAIIRGPKLDIQVKLISCLNEHPLNL